MIEEDSGIDYSNTVSLFSNNQGSVEEESIVLEEGSVQQFTELGGSGIDNTFSDLYSETNVDDLEFDL